MHLPPTVVEPNRIPPDSQTARLRREKRAKGKHVTTVSGLDLEGNNLGDLATRLKLACGTGGTLKNGMIELQGDHLAAVESRWQRWVTKRGGADGPDRWRYPRGLATITRSPHLER